MRVVDLGHGMPKEDGFKVRMAALQRVLSEGRYPVDLMGDLPPITGPRLVGQLVGLARYRMRGLQRGLYAASRLSGLTALQPPDF